MVLSVLLVLLKVCSLIRVVLSVLMVRVTRSVLWVLFKLRFFGFFRFVRFLFFICIKKGFAWLPWFILNVVLSVPFVLSVWFRFSWFCFQCASFGSSGSFVILFVYIYSFKRSVGAVASVGSVV